MSIDEHPGREQTIADYLAVVRRYKWLILIAAVVVPLVAYMMSAQQPKVFRATADVLVNRQDLGTTVTGLSTQTTYTDPERYMRNQAALARVPDVAHAAVAKAGVEKDIDGWTLLGSSDVTPRASTDVLSFGVNSGDPVLAGRLARAYAEAFTEYRLETETTGLARARGELQSRLAELRGSGNADGDIYRELVRKAQDLRTLEYLQVPASILRAPSRGGQIAPAPRRNATLGLVLGLMLGVGGAFVLNALDRRIRHADEVERELQIPLLAKLPTPRRNDPLTVLERPPDEVTEAVARLRTSFDFANAESRLKLIMATSAGAREGKSTTVTNLAIALARAGRRVVLIDLDLRRPSLARLLHLPDRAGITDVAAGTAQLADALQQVEVTPLRARLTALGNPDAGSGTLEVVTAGRTRVDPGEFVESPGLAHALNGLRGRAEIVLIDAPPILATGDAMALSGKVDTLLLISRLGTLTRPALRELVRMLSRSRAPVIGWVATGAEIDEGYATYRAHEAYLSPRPRAQGEAQSPAPLEVPEPRSASAGSGRWTPRRSSG